MSHADSAHVTSTEDVSSEQAADRAALLATIAEGEAGQAAAAEQAAGAEAQQAAAQGQGLGEEISGYLYMFTTVAGKAFPSLVAIYTPDVCAAAGGAIGSLCVKHGWLQGGIGGEYKEEIAAAVVLLPLSLATYQAVKADIRPKKPPEIPVSVTGDNGEAAAGPSGVEFGDPASKAVTFG